MSPQSAFLTVSWLPVCVVLVAPSAACPLLTHVLLFSEGLQHRGGGGGGGGYGGAMTHYNNTPGPDFGPASGGGRKKPKLGPMSMAPPPALQAAPPRDRKPAPPPSLAARGRGGAPGASKGRGVRTRSDPGQAGRLSKLGFQPSSSAAEDLLPSQMLTGPGFSSLSSRPAPLMRSHDPASYSLMRGPPLPLLIPFCGLVVLQGAPPGRGRGGRPGRAAGPLGSLPVSMTINEHVGKRVETFWDEDGWYQAIISDYNPDTVRPPRRPAPAWKAAGMLCAGLGPLCCSCAFLHGIFCWRRWHGQCFGDDSFLNPRFSLSVVNRTCIV